MPAPVVIVGQGIAGTLLGWELERAGIDFQIFDRGHDEAASRVAAGLVNPVAGQRLAKSWRVDACLPMARECYARMGAALGISLWRELRIHRLFRDERERLLLVRRQAEGSLAPYLGSIDAEGFWIEEAALVDVPAMLAAARRRWREAGRLVEEDVPGPSRPAGAAVILCSGAAVRREDAFAFVPWQVAQGELLTIRVTGLEPGVGLNRGHWIVPHGTDRARVGATYLPEIEHGRPTPEAREALAASARDVLGREFAVVAHEAGLRLATPDKHPVVGWSPSDPSVGICAGLGSKGVLLAPWLARQWRDHLTGGAPFDPAVDVSRFSRRDRAEIL